VKSEENLFCSGLYGELQSEGCCSRYVKFSHRALEKGLPPLPSDASILEVGGNLGEHFEFVTHSYSRYVISDYRKVDPPFINARVSFEVENVETLSYSDNSFDRVLMGCLLHHVDQPEIALRQIRRVVKGDGLVSITLPCDPGMLYRVGKKVGPYRALRKRDPSYRPEYFHYRQHRNHFPGLRSLIFETFREDQIKEKAFPFMLKSWNLNLFTIFQIVIKK
jgi:phosphatidylethanolamine/phosphatidyl-N-methylethanolamine N-methyltransferase